MTRLNPMTSFPAANENSPTCRALFSSFGFTTTPTTSCDGGFWGWHCGSRVEAIRRLGEEEKAFGEDEWGEGVGAVEWDRCSR